MTLTADSPVRISGPAELIGAVPYLLGFHPEQSLVFIGLADRQLVVTARLDLADAQDPAGSTLHEAITTIGRAGATGLVAAIFTTTRPPAGGWLPDAELAAAVARSCGAAEVTLTDCLLVAGGRWWSYLCPATGCCPPAGRVLPTEPTALDAAATYAGLTVLPDRAAVAAMFDPPPDGTGLHAELAAARDWHARTVGTGGPERHIQSMTRALFTANRAAAAGQFPSDRDTARYGLALRSYAVRDATWMAVDDDRLPGIGLWVNLARRLPRPYSAAPPFLAGWRAWRDGNGAVATIAAERALAADPAHLLLGALTAGINPHTLPKLRVQKGAAAST